MTVVLSAALPNGVVAPSIMGDKVTVLSNITFSGTYKTGGDASLAPLLEAIISEIGRGTLEWVSVEGAPGYIFKWNFETMKLQLFRTGAAVKGPLEELPEEAYPAAITGAKWRVFVIGR